MCRGAAVGRLFPMLLLVGTSLYAANVPLGDEKSAGTITDSGPKFAVQLLTGALPPNSRPPAGTRSVVMTKANGKKYRCHLPSTDANAESADAAAQPPPPRVASFLGPLKGTCFYRLEGWWTYEFCFNKSIRQFHQEKVKGTLPEKTVVTQDYTLGAWWSADAQKEPATQPATPSASAAVGTDELREDAKTRKKYWSQTYGNGTTCEINGRPRQTEVRLQCSPGEPSFLASVEEVATCSYLVHFSTNLLCRHPGFMADESKDVTQNVQCEPLGPDGEPLPAPPKKAAAERRAAAAIARAAADGAADAERAGAAGAATRAAGARSAAGAEGGGGKGGAAAASGALFDVGECMLHSAYNYRGVVVARDPECTMSEGWMRANGVDALKRGRKQPFYQVLPDTRDRPGAPVNYVAHEHLIPDTPPEPLKHPLISELFARFDAPSGRFVPTPELRARYPLPAGKQEVPVEVTAEDAAAQHPPSDIEDID